MSSFHHAACFHASAFVPKYSPVCVSNANHADIWYLILIHPKEPPFIALVSTCFLEGFSADLCIGSEEFFRLGAGTQIAIHPKSPIPVAFLRSIPIATCIKSYHDHEMSLCKLTQRCELLGLILDFDGDLGNLGDDDQDIWQLFLMFHVLPGQNDLNSSIDYTILCYI